MRYAQVLRQAAQTQIFNALLGDDLGCAVKQFPPQVAMVVVHCSLDVVTVYIRGYSSTCQCCQRLHWLSEPVRNGPCPGHFGRSDFGPSRSLGGGNAALRPLSERLMPRAGLLRCPRDPRWHSMSCSSPA